MPVRRLPVRPDLEQLQRQAKEFLRAIHDGDANAIAEMREHHPERIDPSYGSTRKKPTSAPRSCSTTADRSLTGRNSAQSSTTPPGSRRPFRI